MTFMFPGRKHFHAYSSSRTSPYAQLIQTVTTVRDLELFLNTGFSADHNFAHAAKKPVECFLT